MDVQMSKVQYLVNERGQKTAVVLPIKEYESMQEDLHDLAVMAERRDEPVISFDELKERLERDGLL
jgi:prevent-host-death family protein